MSRAHAFARALVNMITPGLRGAVVRVLRPGPNAAERADVSRSGRRRVFCMISAACWQQKKRGFQIHVVYVVPNPFP